MSKTETTRTAAVSTIHLSLSSLLSKILDVLGLIVLTRVLLTREYGLLVLIFTLPDLLSIFADLNLGTAAAKYISEYQGRKETRNARRVASEYLRTKAVLALICFALINLIISMIVPRNLADQQAPRLFTIASLAILGNSMDDAFYYIFLGFQMSSTIFVTMITFSLVKAIMPPLLYILGYGMIGVVAGYVCPSLVSLTLSIYLYGRNRPEDPNLLVYSDESGFAKRGLKYGLPLVFATAVHQSYFNFLPILIARLNGLEGVAYYQLGFSALSFFNNIFGHSLGTALLPVISGLRAKGDFKRVQGLMYHSSTILLFIVTPVAMFAAATSGYLVPLIFSSKYQSTTLPLTVSLIALPISTFFWIDQSLHLAMGDTKTITKISVLSATIAFASAYSLIPILGSVGASLSLVVFYACLSVTYSLYSRIKYSIRVPLMVVAKVSLATSALIGITILVKTFVVTIAPIQTTLIVLAGAVSYVAISRYLKIVTPQELTYLENAFRNRMAKGVVKVVGRILLSEECALEPEPRRTPED